MLPHACGVSRAQHFSRRFTTDQRKSLGHYRSARTPRCDATACFPRPRKLLWKNSATIVQPSSPALQVVGEEHKVVLGKRTTTGLPSGQNPVDFLMSPGTLRPTEGGHIYFRVMLPLMEWEQSSRIIQTMEKSRSRSPHALSQLQKRSTPT